MHGRQPIEKYDIVIVGAGASGLAAACAAADARAAVSGEPLRILLLEKKEEAGKKILASGNGRCNLTNEACPGAQATRQFFAGLGVMTRTEEGGRVYPYSGTAAAVRDALLQRTLARGAKLRTNAVVQEITPEESGFLVVWEETGGAADKAAGGKKAKVLRGPRQRLRRIRAHQVLLAAGGKAGPAFGTAGAGPGLARALGLAVTRLAPALTAVETEEDVSAAAGARAKARVALTREGNLCGRWDGEVQFTKYGLSGICIFDLSRELVLPEGRTLQDGFRDYRIHVDFLPDLPRGETPDLDVYRLDSIVKPGIADLLLAAAGGDPARAAGLLRDYTLTPRGLKGWDMAQVTRGGVALSEVDPETMEARRVPGLFLAGEVLDYDGPCGGFNLQHAWETGIRAGRAMQARADSD